MVQATGAAGQPPSDDSGEADGLVQLSFIVQDILQRAAAAHGLSLTQVRLVAILRDRTPTMAQLASYLGLDRSSVSGLIDRAEQRDLVRRTAATHDGRVTYVEITAHGQQLAKTFAAEVAPPLQALLARLPTPQRAALAALAATLGSDTLAN